MVKVIVTDIEGTTSSLSFVKDVLFPYARAHLPEYVRGNANEPAVRRELEAVSREAGHPLDDRQAIDRLLAWIDEDRKITPLKALQGMIWERGYREGDYTGHVYPDAAENLKRWRAEGRALYVFSSGSVRAQKLLFAHTVYGDLTPLFAGYFDTNIGAKREPQSYRVIAETIGASPGEILFLSDIVEELDAAATAGMRTTLLTRDGKPPASSHPVARDFNAIKV